MTYCSWLSLWSLTCKMSQKTPSLPLSSAPLVCCLSCWAGPLLKDSCVDVILICVQSALEVLSHRHEANAHLKLYSPYSQTFKISLLKVLRLFLVLQVHYIWKQHVWNEKDHLWITEHNNAIFELNCSFTKFTFKNCKLQKRHVY